MKQQTIIVLISQPDELTEGLEQFDVSIDPPSGRSAVIGRLQKAFMATFTIPEGRERDVDLLSMQARQEISLALDEALAGQGKI